MLGGNRRCGREGAGYRFSRKVRDSVSTAPVLVLVAVTALRILYLPGSSFIAFSSGPLGLKKGPPGTPAVSGPETSAWRLGPGPTIVVWASTWQSLEQTRRISI